MPPPPAQQLSHLDNYLKEKQIYERVLSRPQPDCALIHLLWHMQLSMVTRGGEHILYYSPLTNNIKRKKRDYGYELGYSVLFIRDR